MEKCTDVLSFQNYQKRVLDYLCGKIEIEDIPGDFLDHLRGCENCLRSLCKFRDDINYIEILDVFNRYQALKDRIEHKDEKLLENVADILWDENLTGMSRKEKEQFKEEVLKKLLEPDGISR